MTALITQRQMDFIKSLSAGRPDAGAVLARAGLAFHDGMTRHDASRAIDVLKSSQARPQARPQVAVPEGMHRTSDGTIYKVQRAVHGSGNLYAKRLTQRGDSWEFSFAPGAISRLSEATRMTLEQARQFGALYGTCCACGRTLTDEKSIADGIGPVCARKF